ncbi:MAG: glycosyltransferase [Hydrotalea sp.]|nr:glycosyltransferase [Hydrotalea sp.]
MFSKRIIVFTDSIPSKTGGGISQTLYNLLKGYPTKNITIAIDKLKVNQYKPINDLQADILPINYFRTTVSLKNRIGHVLNKLLAPVEVPLNALFSKFNNKCLPENTILLLSTTEKTIFFQAYFFSIQNNIPLIIYLMDNWITQANMNCYEKKLIRKGFISAKIWIMISQRLNKCIADYFKIQKQVLIIHNPVEVENSDNIFQFSEKKVLPIIYAGSIWEMHLDGLEIISRAVEDLFIDNFKIELWIYCNQGFLIQIEGLLKGKHTKYKGFVNYHELKQKLDDGWLLLVTSSFKRKMEPFTFSSIQTKTTDYISVGRPILSIGPDYSACNDFVEEWKIGYVINTTEIEDIRNYLIRIYSERDKYFSLSENARKVAAENFEIKKQQEVFYMFINNVAK